MAKEKIKINVKNNDITLYNEIMKKDEYLKIFEYNDIIFISYKENIYNILDCYNKENNDRYNFYYMILADNGENDIYRYINIYDEEDEMYSREGIYACGGCGFVSFILILDKLKKNIYYQITDCNLNEEENFIIHDIYFNNKNNFNNIMEILKKNKSNIILLKN